MSFILDALRKSENERQEQASAEFTAIPSAAAPAGAPRWIWILGALLLVNIVVLGFAMLRGGDSAPPAAQAPAPPAEAVATPKSGAPSPAVAAESDFAAQVSSLNVARPRSQANEATSAVPERELTESIPGTPAARGPVPASSSLALPTLNEVRLNEGVNLPDLHLDIHVYSGAPSDRFVFINMHKHQEGSVLEAGPRVEEITPDGVILDFRGTRFVLPRE